MNVSYIPDSQSSSEVRSPLSVSLHGPDLVQVGRTASLVCEYQTGGGEEDTRLQYVSWSRLDPAGHRQFVYDYDPCSGSSRSYNVLAGRATLTVTRFSSDTDSGTSSSLNEVTEGDGDGGIRGQAILTVEEVRSEDEGCYECLVKVIDGPAMSVTFNLSLTGKIEIG